MISPQDAFLLVGERAQATVDSDDDQLALCDALASLAAALKLDRERLVNERLATALRERASAQMEFLGLLKLEVRT